jgi:hypothetical protein
MNDATPGEAIYSQQDDLEQGLQSAAFALAQALQLLGDIRPVDIAKISTPYFLRRLDGPGVEVASYGMAMDIV